jgi:hemerythrin
MNMNSTAPLHSPETPAPEAAGTPFKMDWSDRFALGIDLMDQQHQVLFRLIDQLAKAIQDGNPDQELKLIFGRLSEYTLTHFAAEEALMAQHGYPADQDHIENHRSLVHALSDLVIKAQEGEPLVPLKAMNFLRQWLYEHIDGTDRQFAAFLTLKGLTRVLP